MNCDQVFERLTAPASDDRLVADGERRALTVHLLRCPACRELEQRLVPALELFALAAVEHESLPQPAPCDVGGLAAPARAADALSPGQPWHSAREAAANFHVAPPLGWWRVAAALTLGFLLAGILNGPPEVTGTRHAGWLAAVDSDSHSPDRSAPTWRNFAEHHSPFAVTPPDTITSCGGNTILGLAGNQLCCTACHRAGTHDGAGTPPATAMGMHRLIASCMACHMP